MVSAVASNVPSALKFNAEAKTSVLGVQRTVVIGERGETKDVTGSVRPTWPNLSKTVGGDVINKRSVGNFVR